MYRSCFNKCDWTNSECLYVNVSEAIYPDQPETTTECEGNDNRQAGGGEKDNITPKQTGKGS